MRARKGEEKRLLWCYRYLRGRPATAVAEECLATVEVSQELPNLPSTSAVPPVAINMQSPIPPRAPCVPRVTMNPRTGISVYHRPTDPVAESEEAWTNVSL